MSSPGGLGAILLAVAAAVFLMHLSSSPAPNDLSSHTFEAMLTLAGLALIAYHFICFRKYQGDNEDMDANKPEANAAKNRPRHSRRHSRRG